MRTNVTADINTNWQINGIVKPNHVNALTRSIKYDYVVTAQMLEGKTGNVDVFDILGIGINQGTLVPGDTYILINTPVSDSIILKFPGNQAGSSGHFNIHIYTLGAFKADCAGTSPMISFFFHTHGTSGAVTLLGLGADMYVGSFIMESPLTLPNTYSKFTYEMALGELPTLSETGGIIQKVAWMSNAISSIPTIADIGTEQWTNSDNGWISTFTLPAGVTVDDIVDQLDQSLSSGHVPIIKWVSSIDNDFSDPTGRNGLPCTKFALLTGIRCNGFFFKDPVTLAESLNVNTEVQPDPNENPYIYIGVNSLGTAYIGRKEWREL